MLAGALLIPFFFSPSLTMKLIPLQPEHAPLYHKWLSRKDMQEATRTDSLSYEQVLKICSKDDSHSWLIKADDDVFIGDLNIFIHSQEDKSLIGEVNVMVAEEQYRRQGYAKRAILEGISRSRECSLFIARIDHQNVASQRLFASLGFTCLQKDPNVFGELEYIL